jgi:CubicO group peptidase (beta-lactamase class C family)
MIIRKPLIPIVGPLLAMVSLVRGNPQGAAGPFAEVRAKIVRLIEEKKSPSLSLAVVGNGGIVWEEAFGLASLEKRIPATPRTMYPIASATKPITATALMVLVERGLVDLDRPANGYLKGAGLRAWEGSASGATVRRILQHTSGLPMYWNFYYAGTSRQRPALDVTLQRYGLLVSRPGDGYNYSNLGYAVLESIIENASGRSYPEFLAAEIFAPLQMGRAAIFTALPDGSDVADKYSAALAPVPFCDHDTRGASAVYSTARDLALFLLLHLGRLQADQKPILRPVSIDAMRESRDPDVRSSSYGLGWENGRRYGYSIVTHGGAMDGCRAELAMIPSEGLAAVVLANGENVAPIQICDWIFAALLPEYARSLKAAPAGGGPPPAPPPFRPRAELIGTWEGVIKSHEGETPVRLVVEPDGRVELYRPGMSGVSGKGLAPLKPPRMDRNVFIAHFPQVFLTSDAPASGHRTVLGLALRGDRLSGEANLIADDLSYSFPSYASLKRAETK